MNHLGRVVCACALLAAVGCAKPTQEQQSAKTPVPELNQPHSRKAIELRDEIPPSPTVEPGALWASDRPKQFPPMDFGTFTAERSAVKPAVSAVKLTTTLPSVPARLLVYVGGVYVATHRLVFAERAPRQLAPCVFNAGLSIADCTPAEQQSIGVAPIKSAAEAERRAREALGDLLLSDWYLQKAVVSDYAEAHWRVSFTQRVNDLPLYTDKPLSIAFDDKGRPSRIQGRRRPLMAQSEYPLRPPEQAWQELESGRGFGIDLLPDRRTPVDGQIFEVAHIELAYVVAHVLETKEIVQPYYLFGDNRGRALLVPAVADPYVSWPTTFLRTQ